MVRIYLAAGACQYDCAIRRQKSSSREIAERAQRLSSRGPIKWIIWVLGGSWDQDNILLALGVQSVRRAIDIDQLHGTRDGIFVDRPEGSHD
jgi:hypothetical protein